MSKGGEKAVVVGSYKLGAVLGKGGFGTVYSCLDEEQGGFCAIKQINLSKIPKDQLNGIMQEIDLLKNLNHTNIVKYIKYIKTKDFLYIVLELVENGSLASIVKKFGKFPESLVCTYITQVLEGLVYLHEQGVVHRDIKGANILTTKEGIIKLADFGVATKFGDENASAVVGTPYWMAPEIIELNGSTTASDIWSVGCTVIELLTGAPPYYDLGPMPALFRIVQDDYPPLPEGISPALKDWLMQCFQKDPLLRISAQKLLKHKWIKSRRKPAVTETPDVERIMKYNEEKPQKPLKLAAPPPKEAAPQPPPQKKLQKYVEEDEESDWGGDFNTPTGSTLGNLKNAALSPGKGGDSGKKEPKPSPLRSEHHPAPTPKSPLAKPTPPKKSHAEEDESWDDFGAPADGPSSGGIGQLKGLLGNGASIGDDDGFGDDFADTDNKKLLANSKDKKTLANQFAKKLDGNNNNTSIKSRINSKVANGVLNKFQENDKEDWEDDLGARVVDKIKKEDKGGYGSLNLAERLQKKKVGAAITSTASVRDIWEEEEEELETNGIEFLEDDIVDQKDVWSKMNEQILRLMGKLQLSQSEDVILSTTQELITLFKENPDQKTHMIRNIGVIPIMEMLEGSNTRVLESILKVVNQIIENNIEIKENLCLVGGIPAIMKFSGRDYSMPIRLECANFVSQMCSTSTVTLQMFIACRGLPVLVDILSTSYVESKNLVWLATDAICSVFELQSTTPKNDFCRLFSKCGLLPVLASVMKITSEDAEAAAKDYPAKIANLFLVFSAADGVVKLSMSQPEVLTALFDPLDHDRLRPEVMVKILKAIKQLSMDHSTLALLQRAGAIRRLVRALARRPGPGLSERIITETHNHALNAIYNLCKLDQERQFIAAQDGVVPHLMHIIVSQSPLRQFALPIVCDLAHVKRARGEMWKHQSIEFYLDLLSDKNWQVNALDSISVWLADETEKVEKIVAKPQHVAKIVNAFTSADSTTFANLMEPLLHIVTTSVKINVEMGKSPEFVPRLLDRLRVHPKAEVRVNLLRILTSLYKCHENPKAMMAKFNLYPVVKELTNNNMVLVQKLASQLIVAFNTNTVL